MKYTIILTSTSQKSLNVYVRYLQIFLKKLSLKNSTVSLPVTRRRISLLKSPHVYKKAKEHFEVRTYRKNVTFESFNKIEKLILVLANKPKSICVKIKTNIK